jgi:hypothetical protein
MSQGPESKSKFSDCVSISLDSRAALTSHRAWADVSTNQGDIRRLYSFGTIAALMRTIIARCKLHRAIFKSWRSRLHGEACVTKNQQAEACATLRQGINKSVDLFARVVEVRRDAQPISAWRSDNVSLLEMRVEGHRSQATVVANADNLRLFTWST